MQSFWCRRFLKIFNAFLLCCYYFPLEKGNLHHPRWLCEKLGLVVLKKKNIYMSMKYLHCFAIISSWKRHGYSFRAVTSLFGTGSRGPINWENYWHLKARSHWLVNWKLWKQNGKEGTRVVCSKDVKPMNIGSLANESE